MKLGPIAASLFFFALPVHAQIHSGGGGAAPTQLNATGGGGGGFGGLSAVSFSFAVPVINRTAIHYSYIYEQGSDATFVPTRFVSYNKAVEMGKEALAYRPKTIVEVAAEYRTAKKQVR